MKYLTSKQVMERYQISAMSLHRWERDEKSGFPKPLVINRRKLYAEEDLVKWERGKVRP